MFQNIGTVEIIIIALVLMILFGAKKIPEFAKGLGEAGTEFKKGLKGQNKEEKTSEAKKEAEEK